jgi:hypothetical protein
MEHEDPQYAGDRGRYRIRPYEERLVRIPEADLLVGLGGEQQGAGEGQNRNSGREYRCRHHGPVIFGLLEQ